MEGRGISVLGRYLGMNVKEEVEADGSSPPREPREDEHISKLGPLIMRHGVATTPSLRKIRAA